MRTSFALWGKRKHVQISKFTRIENMNLCPMGKNSTKIAIYVGIGFALQGKVEHVQIIKLTKILDMNRCPIGQRLVATNINYFIA